MNVTMATAASKYTSAPMRPAEPQTRAYRDCRYAAMVPSETSVSIVVAWAGWPFHRSAWVNLRHGATTMDTLVSVATIAAYLQSVYTLVWGSAGRMLSL